MLCRQAFATFDHDGAIERVERALLGSTVAGEGRKTGRAAALCGGNRLPVAGHGSTQRPATPRTPCRQRHHILQGAQGGAQLDGPGGQRRGAVRPDPRREQAASSFETLWSRTGAHPPACSQRAARCTSTTTQVDDDNSGEIEFSEARARSWCSIVSRWRRPRFRTLPASSRARMRPPAPTLSPLSAESAASWPPRSSARSS